MTKLFLKESIDTDFILIAITAPLKDYIMCHKLNKAINAELCRDEDHEVYSPLRKSTSYFPKYYQFFEEFDREYYLISNRSTDSYLIEEMKTVDYFMQIHQFIDDEDLDFILVALKKIPEVLAVNLIDIHKIKSRENLAV